MGGDQVKLICSCGLGRMVSQDYIRLAGSKCPECHGLLDRIGMVSQQSARRNARLHGFSQSPWDQFKKVQEEVQELADAMKAFAIQDEATVKAMAEEMADVYLSMATLAELSGIDLAGAVERKHLRNIMRPLLHGREEA